jgi:hypothetical protein
LLVAATALAKPVELSNANFDDQVYNSGKKAFVKFFAPWYVPCVHAFGTWMSVSGASIKRAEGRGIFFLNPKIDKSIFPERKPSVYLSCK